MAIRAFPYRPEFREDFNRVRSRVYRGGEPVRDEEDLVPTDCSATLVELDGSIVGAATSIHYDCTFGRTTLRSAGVAAVGVLPESRRSGAGSALMHAVNRQLRDEGFSMALLYPYSAAFYRRFGYEYAGNRLTLSCPRTVMPKIEHALPAREIKVQDAESIRACYESFAARHHGMNRRNDLQWARALGGEKPFHIFAVGEPVEAYALIRLEWTFWVDQAVREVVWSTPLGYRSILAFLKGLAANKSAVTWNEPSASPWLSQFGERDVQVTANQQIMWRVLDVEQALSSLTCESDVEFTVRVVDSEFEENSGPWRVQTGRHGSEVGRAETAEVTIDVRQLAQALIGEPSFRDLHSMGLVSCDSPRTAMAASLAFGSNSGYCLEYF